MQDLSNITTLDLVIVVLYLLGMLGIGVYFVRRIQNAGDYYVAGRSLGPLVLAGTVCATIIGGSAMMGRAGLGYDYGSLAVVTALPYLIGMFVFSGISGRIQEVGVKYNITSIPELFEKRFSKTAKCLIALLIGYTMMGTVASQITAVAVIVKMIGGKIGITYEMGACLATFIFIFYTAASGLFGVVYTDVVQFFMLIIFVYILLPLSGIRYLGGFGNFWSNVPKEMLIPNIDGKVVGDIVTYLVFTMAGAEMWQRAFAAKSRKAAKEGDVLGYLHLWMHHFYYPDAGADGKTDPAECERALRNCGGRHSGAGNPYSSGRYHGTLSGGPSFGYDELGGQLSAYLHTDFCTGPGKDAES